MTSAMVFQGSCRALADVSGDRFCKDYLADPRGTCGYPRLLD
jgi:hypothetical protein